MKKTYTVFATALLLAFFPLNYSLNAQEIIEDGEAILKADELQNAEAEQLEKSYVYIENLENTSEQISEQAETKKAQIVDANNDEQSSDKQLSNTEAIRTEAAVAPVEPAVATVEPVIEKSINISDDSTDTPEPSQIITVVQHGHISAKYQIVIS